MKKTRKKHTSISIIGFCLFFITIALTSASSVMIFNYVNVKTDGNTLAIMFWVFITILIGAIFCSVFDYLRRKNMMEKPVQTILDATAEIASGNFNVKLVPVHEFTKYDEYDLIFDNINIMASELAKNELLKNDFISNVSHEIKTPLAVIQNYAKALQNPNLNQSIKTDYLNGLINQTKKLSNLVTNILKLNKLENQEIVDQVQKTDLAELIRICTLQFENLIEQKNLQLECDIDETEIITSASLVEIAMNNLLSNAIKFTNKGGKISVSLKSDAEFAIIKVSDTGCGISNEVGQHIFDKFYQGDTSHSAEGNGLGLALVKKVIDLIGGEIKVESKVNVGSTFIIKLKKEK